MGGICSKHGESACDILYGKPKGKRPLGRTGRSWKDKNDVREIELNWFRIMSNGVLFVYTVMSIRLP
jgi:hypothetical protein